MHNCVSVSCRSKAACGFCWNCGCYGYGSIFSKFALFHLSILCVCVCVQFSLVLLVSASELLRSLTVLVDAWEVEYNLSGPAFEVVQDILVGSAGESTHHLPLQDTFKAVVLSILCNLGQAHRLSW